MSRGVNRVQLLGRIGRDAETKQTTGGIAVSNFTPATNRSVKSATGYKQRTDWDNVVVWRSENLGPYLTKGKQVFVEGRREQGTPHRFRDTFAIELLLQGVPIERVAVLLGRSRVRVTE